MTTSGSPLDPDGYLLVLDDTLTRTIPPSGQVAFPDVPVGPHSLHLQDIALNCTSDWYAPRPVTVQPAESTAVAYSIRCDTPSPLPIVFSSSRDNILRDVYRSNESGTIVERLTTFSADQPSLSPGGTRIVFLRSVGTGYLPLLWVMDADGGNPIHLGADSTHLVEWPQWSPDGTHLVFMRWSGPYERQVAITTADGRSEEILATGSVQDSTAGWGPRWSPDGRTISYNTYIGHVIGIRLVDLPTRQVHDIVLPGDSLGMNFPTWAPAGDRLLVRVGPPRSYTYDISTIRLDGTGLTVLAPAVLGAAGGFVYAPDGSKIIGTADDSGAFFDLYTLPATGGALTDISNTPTSHEFFPSWGP